MTADMPVGRIRVIGHRGASAHYPENTLASFRGAMQAGAPMVELDAQLSRDGAVVVIHDETVDRTTNGRGLVANLSLAELRRLDAGGGERIPLLAEVLELPVAVNVEIKDSAAVEAVAQLVAGRENVVVSSFDLDALDRVRQLAPRLPLAYLSRQDDWRVVLERAQSAGAYALNPPRQAVTGLLVEEAHRAGLHVMSYTVNDPGEGRRLQSLGVDALFTDDPAAMLAAIG